MLKTVGYRKLSGLFTIILIKKYTEEVFLCYYWCTDLQVLAALIKMLIAKIKVIIVYEVSGLII